MVEEKLIYSSEGLERIAGIDAASVTRSRLFRDHHKTARASSCEGNRLVVERRNVMDKERHPHVIRTWTVERTKVPCRLPQPSKARPSSHGGFRPQEKNSRAGSSKPKQGQ
jgi:hypothetical protein